MFGQGKMNKQKTTKQKRIIEVFDSRRLVHIFMTGVGRGIKFYRFPSVGQFMSPQVHITFLQLKAYLGE